MGITRRELLGMGAAIAMNGPFAGTARHVRGYEVCLTPDALKEDPGLLETVHDAGVRAVWLPGFFYGFWPYPLEETRRYAQDARRLGMEAYIIDLALGHPGDALGAMHGGIPLSPPRHWRLAQRMDGTTYAGTSLHDPAVQENCLALASIRREGYRRVFLDDDFRLAQSPGMVGGCFCPQHQEQFLQTHDYTQAHWRQLLDDIRERRFTPILKSWCDWNCRLLQQAFRAQQKAAGSMHLGIMVMYMGAEKAGIGLEDYQGALFRVGEGHFDDASLASPKGWTDELFSALFHRRFVKPEVSYSETTAFPANALSAANMAAKLTVSTLADVRTTCFMSGLSPFPKAHWQVLAPRMRREAAVHSVVAGQRMAGPVKLWWGIPGRYVGDDNPYSLPMALGIPFEMCRQQPKDGWIFLGDQDAAEKPREPLSAGAVVIHRPNVTSAWANARAVSENLSALRPLRRQILASHPGVPHVVEEVPAALAWYPGARAAIVWNLGREAVRATVQAAGTSREVALEPLGAALLQDLPVSSSPTSGS